MPRTMPISMSKTRLIALIIVSSILLSACGTAKNITRSIVGGGNNVEKAKSKKSKKTVSLNLAQRNYDEAYRQMTKGFYEDALASYNKLTVQYPFGDLTEQAKLDSIFVLHKLGRKDDAKRVAENFIEQHPTHENIDYAYYMKGVTLFPKNIGFLGRIAGSNKLRDKAGLLEAYTAFKEYMEKFPENEEADDVKKRMAFLENAVARDELRVAKYYKERKAYVAVINRSQYIVENYSQTPSARDALLLMRDTYTKMELPQLAKTTQTVIDANSASVAEVEADNEEARRNKAITRQVSGAIESLRKAAFTIPDEEDGTKRVKVKRPPIPGPKSRTNTKYYPY